MWVVVMLRVSSLKAIIAIESIWALVIFTSLVHTNVLDLLAIFMTLALISFYLLKPYRIFLHACRLNHSVLQSILVNLIQVLFGLLI